MNENKPGRSAIWKHMSNFIPKDPDYEKRIRGRFSNQGLLKNFSARLQRIAPGEAELVMPFDQKLTQQDGYLHAGAITTLVDSACGYAAYTLMPAGSRVLSVEFKINLLSPAKGDHFLARGRVVKPGRTITVCEGKFYSFKSGEKKLSAVMQATMICIQE
jgi:uncharacterized protein (TIGR00369 family)